ncbi:MAG: (2Fe-2S)-binding protein [Candidatus Hodarchaeales archaeon]
MILKSVTSLCGKEIKILPEVKPAQKEEKICPISRTKGLIVKKITLRGHVKEKFWNIISDEHYYFCPHKLCPIIYFNNEKEHYFIADDLKTRVSWKEGPEPRPICYCLNVLEHNILDEILVTKRATTLNDIKQYTGARTGKICHITNPSGRCCGPQVNEIIAKGLLLLEADKEVQEEVLDKVHSGCIYCKDDWDYMRPSIEAIADACETCNVNWEMPSKNEL